MTAGISFMCGDQAWRCGRAHRLLSIALLSIFAAASWLSLDAAASGRDAQPAKPSQPAHTITGTLALLDISTGKGMLKTDLDKPVFFEVTRPDHFVGLSIGDRVTVQLDDEGRMLKVIEALPAEVHEPPPAPVQ